MNKLLIAVVTTVSLLAGSIALAAPASAAPLGAFCWHHPYAPICQPHGGWYHHHHHHHHYWW